MSKAADRLRRVRATTFLSSMEIEISLWIFRSGGKLPICWLVNVCQVTTGNVAVELMGNYFFNQFWYETEIWDWAVVFQNIFVERWLLQKRGDQSSFKTAWKFALLEGKVNDICNRGNKYVQGFFEEKSGNRIKVTLFGGWGLENHYNVILTNMFKNMQEDVSDVVLG